MTCKIHDDMQKSSGDDGKLFENHLQLEEETTHASGASATTANGRPNCKRRAT